MIELLKPHIDFFPGEVRLHARNLKTGAEVDIGGNEAVRTASTIKLPIMAAVFH